MVISWLPGHLTRISGDSEGKSGYGSGPALTETLFNAPGYSIADPFGHIFVTDVGNHLVRLLKMGDEASGGSHVSTVAGKNQYGISGKANVGWHNKGKLNTPVGIAIDREDRLVVTNEASNTIVRVSPGQDSQCGIIEHLAGKLPSSNLEQWEMALKGAVGRLFVCLLWP
jgi:hypothetical protein